jgi:hypothetical protein
MRKHSGAFAKVRELARDLPDTEESTMYGAPALKVRGRMFACIASHRSAEADTLVVRVPFRERDRLIASDSTTFYVMPHYLGYPCVLVRLGRIQPRALRGLLHLGWRFVVGNQRQVRSEKPEVRSD